MPTIDVSRTPPVAPTTDVGLQLPRGAFSAEARAVQRFGRGVKEFGDELTTLRKKIEIQEEQRQFDEGILRFDKFKDEQNSARLKNTNFTSHRDDWDTAFDQTTPSFLEGMTGRAKAQYKTYLARQKVVQGIKIESDAHRMSVKQAEANEPAVIQASVKSHYDASADEKEIIRSEYKAGLANRVAAGSLTQESAEDLMRIRAMRIVQEGAELSPETAVEDTKTRESLQASLLFGLTEEDIALLTAEDMDVLQADAEAEVSGRRAERITLNKAAVLEAENEYSHAILTPKGRDFGRLRARIIADPRYNSDLKAREARVGSLDDTVESITENAKKKPNVNEKLRVLDDINSVLESTNLTTEEKKKKAYGILDKNAWMFETGTPAASTVLTQINEKGDEPTDVLLNDAIGSVDEILRLQIAQVKAKKKTTDKERAVQIADLEVNANSLKQDFRDKRAKGDLTADQWFAFTRESLKPAKEDAAKDTISLWRRIFPGFLRVPTFDFDLLQPVAIIDIPRISTQAEFDSLPNGARYIDVETGIPARKGGR